MLDLRIGKTDTTGWLLVARFREERATSRVRRRRSTSRGREAIELYETNLETTNVGDPQDDRPVHQGWHSPRPS
jgi:hypothetical protein